MCFLLIENRNKKEEQLYSYWQNAKLIIKTSRLGLGTFISGKSSTWLDGSFIIVVFFWICYVKINGVTLIRIDGCIKVNQIDSEAKRESSW